MRIKHFFGLAVLAAMTASCSSNNDLVNGGNGSGENESGASYASFSINLPTTRSTRAGSAPEFNQGKDNEYDVFNATLLVFKKGTATSKEGDYTLAETVDFGSLEPWKDPSETGVTTQAKITAKLSKVDKSGDYFALVLLNNGSGTDAKVTLPSEGDTFSAWNVATDATNFTDTKKGFYMANAPLYNATDKSVTTLVAIDKNKIFPTEAQASSGEAAADIYVERGLAKVTLTTATKDKKTVAASSSYAGDTVKISNWALDVTNKKTFPIHNVDGLSTDYAEIWNNDAKGTTAPSTQRFVDNNTGTKVKRVYWGTDPNYKETNLSAETPESKKARTENFNYIQKENLTADPKDPLYCRENTFNLANMVQGQTTRVIFKASYTPKGFTAADGKTFFKVGTSVALWKKKDLENHIKAAVTKVISGATTANTTIDLAATGNDITAAGNHEIKASNISVTGHKVTEAEEKAVNEKVGLTKNAGISTYANGESYYIARIKHFGDDLTPWKSGVYGSNNLEYLGRYGMLRNNWYELDVQSVSGPGYPDVPEVKPNTPDDEDDKYIKVSVKILDWAKRTQKVDL